VSGENRIEAATLPLVAAMCVPYMAAAFARWRTARRRGLQADQAGAPIPTEQAADPLGLAEALSQTALVDVLLDPLDFRVRYVGAEMAKAQGADHTGQRVSELRPHRYVGLIMEAYTAVAASREPKLQRVLLQEDARHLAYVRLLLPLSKGGDGVDTIWAVAHYERAIGRAGT
jgi:hypothetical protein